MVHLVRFPFLVDESDSQEQGLSPSALTSRLTIVYTRKRNEV
jgi:hypothetical protein